MITKNTDIVGRKVHDSFFLIDIKENYANDKCSLYEINSMGEFIWDQLDELDDVSGITDVIVRNTSGAVEYSVVFSDVTEFINTLLSLNFLGRTDGRD